MDPQTLLLRALPSTHPAGASVLGELHKLLGLADDDGLPALRRRIRCPTTELAKAGVFKLGGKPLPGRTALQQLAKAVVDAVPRYAATIATVHHCLACASLGDGLSDERAAALRCFTGEPCMQ